MKKLLQKIFLGYSVLETAQSSFNGRILVEEDLLGYRRLVVGGLTQSGRSVEKLWEVALGKIKDWRLVIKNCLILGLGAGSFAKLVAQDYSGIHILGVEIDPEMVRLGRDYFDLGEIPSLEIKIANAVKTTTILGKFDLVLVDLYSGDREAEGSDTNKFLRGLEECVSENGAVIFNRLYYGQKIERTDEFERKIEKFFKKVEAKKILMNKLFLCRN